MQVNGCPQHCCRYFIKFLTGILLLEWKKWVASVAAYKFLTLLVTISIFLLGVLQLVLQSWLKLWQLAFLNIVQYISFVVIFIRYNIENTHHWLTVKFVNNFHEVTINSGGLVEKKGKIACELDIWQGSTSYYEGKVVNLTMKSVALSNEIWCAYDNN